MPVGLTIDNSAGALSHTGAGSTALSIKDADGLTIANADASYTVNLKATAATTLTIDGDVVLASGHNLTVPTLSQYQLVVGGASGLLSSLTAGTTNQVLRGSTGAAPTWGAVTSSHVDSSISLSTHNHSGVYQPAGTYVTPASTLVANRVTLSNAAAAVTDSANFTFNGSAMAITGTLGLTGSQTITAGSLSSVNALDVTATFATANAERGMDYNFTINGSGVVTKLGEYVGLTGSYTSAGSVIGIQAYANLGVTGSDLKAQLGEYTSDPLGQVGISGRAGYASSGAHIGVEGRAWNNSGSPCIGVLGKAFPTAVTGGAAGVVGVAQTYYSAGNLGVGHGSYFAVFSQTTTMPSLSSVTRSAVIGQSFVSAANLFLGRDASGNSVFSVYQNGLTSIAPAVALSTGEHALAIAMTMATSTNDEKGLHLEVTSAGSGAGTKSAFNSVLYAGYTGTARSVTAWAENQVAGTGASLGVDGYNITGNAAVHALAQGSTTTGYNAGVDANATNGLVNAGVIGRAGCINNASAIGVGVIGNAQYQATGKQVGGYFSTWGATNPTFTNCALIANVHGGSAYSVFRAEIGGTVNFEINGSGSADFKYKPVVNFTNQTSRPGSPVAGTMYFDTSTKQIWIYDGAAWYHTAALTTP